MNMNGRTNRVAADARRLLNFLSARRARLSPLLVLTHDYPDPDSIASAAALKFIAETVFNIRCDIAYGGVIGRTENREMVSRLKVPIRPLKKTELARAKNVALVDTQPAFRNNRFPPDRRAAIVIDQHRSDVPPNADLSIVNLHCGATSVILSQALFLTHETPPPLLATALAYGILTDTLNFFRAHEPFVMQTYLRLMPHCDLVTLAKIQNPTRSSRFFTTLARGIRLAMSCRDVIVSHLGEVENPDLVSQTADFFLTYESIRWSLITGRYKGRLCMSLRTRVKDAEAGEILRDICGDRASAGGHGGMAGGSFEIGRTSPPAVWRAEENNLLVRLLERLRVRRRFPIRFPFRDDTGERK
jgi:nanoRNase/pAp phosphatase (c-di-AMP/oligoRNAs hydrolase)